MKVLVDTSVWADFFNDHPSREAAVLADLLAGDDDLCTCGVIVAEVFQGLRRDKERETIRRSFEDLTFLEPSGIGLYLRSAEVYRRLRAVGRTVRSTIDCLIVALAEENDCTVLSRDRDVETILGSGLVQARGWSAPSRP